MREDHSMLNLKNLKERGWTPALVKKFLGSPDATRPNPRYRSAAPMQLYSLARIEQIEQEEQWKQAKARATQRSEAGKTVAVRKAAALIEAAEQMTVRVQRLPLETVANRAIASYNAYHEELSWQYGYDYEPASAQSDPAFLERITVNYIRHHLTSYDSHLEEVAGQVGVHKAGKVIRRRLYDEIAKEYPKYAEECKRQMQARYG